MGAMVCNRRGCDRGNNSLEIDNILDMVDEAVALLRLHEPEEGYIGCFSGGKDSITIKALAKMAGVRVEWHYHKTTIDPPELVKFMRDTLTDKYGIVYE